MQYTKYPRTFHLPFSPGKTSDDKTLSNMDHFIGKQIVITEKMDGENCTIYRNYCHARSLDSRNHPSRNWVKRLMAEKSDIIPEGMRICGENLYAKHSIHYENLSSYFLVFGIYINDVCLSWKETVEWCQLLELQHVPVLFEGMFGEELVKNCFTGISKFQGEQEGYVVRISEQFAFTDFSTSVAKFVRKNHVQTDEHWMNSTIIKNELL